MWSSQQHITLFSGVLIGRDQLRYYSGHKTHGEHFDAWRTQRKFKLVRAKIPVHDDVESPGTVDKQVAFSAFVKENIETGVLFRQRLLVLCREHFGRNSAVNIHDRIYFQRIVKYRCASRFSRFSFITDSLTLTEPFPIEVQAAG